MMRQPTHEPPTSEEMLAYVRGELSEVEEERFRDRLIGYPELVRTLTAPFPADGAMPGDEDYLSDQEFAGHWTAMQQRMSRSNVVPIRPAATRVWQSVAAIAAALNVVIGALYWQAHVELGQPRVIAVAGDTLMPDGNQRSVSTEIATVKPHDDNYSLMPILMDERPFDSYRVELFDARVTPPRSLWNMSGLHRDDKSALLVTIPRSFVSAGVYRLSIYGTRGTREEHVNDYTIRVTP